MSSWSPFDDFRKLWKSQDRPSDVILLVSASLARLRHVRCFIDHHQGPVIVVVDTNFAICASPNRLFRERESVTSDWKSRGYSAAVLVHNEYGGVTNASHLVFFRGFASEAFAPPQCVPQVLKHLISPAAPGRYTPIDPPPRLRGHIPRTPIVVDGLLQQEGLLDVTKPLQWMACPSVFAKSGWVKRQLTISERMKAFDIPDALAHSIRSTRSSRLPFDIENGITPQVVTSLFTSLWGSLADNSTVDTTHHPTNRVTSNPNIRSTDASIANITPNASVDLASPSTADSTDEVLRSKDSSSSMSNASGQVEARATVDDGWMYLADVNIDAECIDRVHFDIALDDKGDVVELDPSHGTSLSNCNNSSRSGVTSRPSTARSQLPSLSPSQKRLEGIKRDHALAKAVKSDDAEVPVHLWNKRICHGPCTTKQADALETIRSFFLQVYRRRVLKDCRSHLMIEYGTDWVHWRRRWKDSKLTASKFNAIKKDMSAFRDIVWRCCHNSWFEYPSGSRVMFHRLPKRYRKLGRDGVKVYFVGPPPSRKKSQPIVPPDETAILRGKIEKMIQRRYLVPPNKMLSSLIFYFGVPKGILEGVVQDWRIVYHAGANGLNDAVWAPSFWLPRVDSLLRLVDLNSSMEDRDIGEMFLNFELDPEIRQYTGIDIRPLGLDEEVCNSGFVHWTRNLMGFKPSPYNSVKTYLIIEELLRGDRHDTSNAFQWQEVALNLPGTKDYKPNQVWISKRREDGSLASDFVCFMDDQRVVGEGDDRILEAGHTLSSRESYFGVQDALRKLREGGTGAWAGSVVLVDDELGVVVLTSQEKWDKMKAIIVKWLQKLEAGEDMLEHAALLSDRGFLVYVTQAYPALKPYLKGINLSMETWRGNRDAEGYKLPPDSESTSSASPSTALPSESPEDELIRDWELIERDDFDLESKILLDEKSVQDSPESSPPVFGPKPPPQIRPDDGLTKAVPRLLDDLKALQELTDFPSPRLRVVRSKVVLTAVYGFGDASSGGFGFSVERPDGIQVRYGIWGRDEETASSNYRELLNLVLSVEAEADAGHLRNSELWLFTDNSTAENCFYKGSSSSKHLHELILRLRKVEMEIGLTIHLVHVAGTRMIAQGTDGLSRGVLLEGVMAGKDMLSFVDLSKSALERHPPLLDYLRWVTECDNLQALTPEQWFVEGHGIIGGSRDSHGMWIPTHAPPRQFFLWAPPPVVADVALEECLKSVHKRTDCFHVVVIPRLFTPHWRRMFQKLCDFIIHVPAGSSNWPSHLHEPLWIGISLPFILHSPWCIRGTPLLVEMERKLRTVFSTGTGDGRHLVRQLLRASRRLCTVSKRVAQGMLHVPRPGPIPNGQGSRR